MTQLNLEGDWLPILEEVMGWIVEVTTVSGYKVDLLVTDIEWDDGIVWVGVNVTDESKYDKIPDNRQHRLQLEPDIRIKNKEGTKLYLY